MYGRFGTERFPLTLSKCFKHADNLNVEMDLNEKSNFQCQSGESLGVR